MGETLLLVEKLGLPDIESFAPNRAFQHTDGFVLELIRLNFPRRSPYAFDGRLEVFQI